MSLAKKISFVDIMKSYLSPGFSGTVVEHVKDKQIDSAEIIVGVGVDESQILSFVSNNKTSHFVQSSPFEDREMQVAAVLIEDPKKYFDSAVETILNPQADSAIFPVVIMERSFSLIKERNDILAELRGKISPIVKSTSVQDDILSIADELITNSIYNAPFSIHGIIKKIISRTSKNVSMGKDKQGKLTIAHDGQRLLVCCKDPFGSLSLSRLFEKISNCYRKGVASSINMGPGGAGIGSFMVFDKSSSYYVGVNTGRETLFSCVVPYKIRASQRQSMGKSIHIISIKD